MQTPAFLDFLALFEATSALCVVVLPDAPQYTVVAVTDAYLSSVMLARDVLVGHAFLDAFPENPADPAAMGAANVRASLARAAASRGTDVMAVQKYDVRRPDGTYEERYWSATHRAIVGADDGVVCLLHEVVDVTEYYRDQNGRDHAKRNADLEQQTRRLESELFLRAQELAFANERLHAVNERLLADAESQFRALFDFMPQLGWTALPDGFIEFYNRGWYEYTGTTYEQMQGWGWKDVHDPAILPTVVERWQHSLATGTPFEMEFPLRRADGVFRWFLTRVLPMRDQQGRIVRWVGINTDIDDRRRSGTEKEARLQLLIESIQDYAVFMLDAAGGVVTWPPGAERLEQWRADEILAKHFSVFYPEDDVLAGKPGKDLGVAASVGRFEEEGIRVRRDGSRFRASVVIGAIRDDQGQLLGFSKVIRDLTERQQHEAERLRLIEEREARRAAQQSEERLRFLADASAILSSSLDYETTLQALARIVVPRYADWCSVDLLEEGRIKQVAVAHVDPSKVQLARELQQRWPRKLDDPRGSPQVIRTGESELIPEITDEMLKQSILEEERLHIARQLKLRSALIVPLSARSTTLGALTLIWAESGHKYGPEDVPLIEEIARRAAIAVDNARLYREAQEAVRLRDEFLSIASHELKTPLTTIVLHVTAMLRGIHKSEPTDLPKLAKRLATVDAHVHRLANLIEELLDVARATAGRLKLEVAEVDLDEVVRDAASRLAPNFAAARSPLVLQSCGRDLGMWDRARLDQVVTNLLTNALKYGGGKPVHLETRRGDGVAILVVEDQGIGIAASDHTRIFERFARAVPAENYGGLGLGLWISKELLDAMGGTISVESEPGRGARFTVVLPKVPKAG